VDARTLEASVVSLICPAIDQSLPLAERLASYVDCHAQALGQAGFADDSRRWLGPALLAGCLTIYVALIGYRFVLGQTPSYREALLATLRAGIIIAFVSSWPAYGSVVYRVVIEGPTELAGELLAPSGLAGQSLPDIAHRADEDFLSLEQEQAPQQPPSQGSAQSPAARPVGVSVVGQSTVGREPDPISSKAGLFLVVSAVGGLAMVRLAGGILLALGPIAITMALFDYALGVFEGWVRALLGLMLAAAGVMIVSALELDFFEAQLTPLGSIPDPATLPNPSAVIATAVVFGGISLAVISAAFVVGRGFRIPSGLKLPLPAPLPQSLKYAFEDLRPGNRTADYGEARRSRVVADALGRMGERERALGLASRSYFRVGLSGPELSAAAADGVSGSGNQPQTPSRRTIAPPRTASAERRDNRP
jgi:type IV secretion system protein VirB6